MQLTHNNGHKRTSEPRPTFNADVLFEQVSKYLAGEIAAGAWGIGVPLPKETDLARDLGVSTGTLRKALGILEADGIIERIQGKGTFVLDKVANDQQRKLACIKRSLLVIKEAIEEAGQNTTPKLQSALQTRFAEALFLTGYSGDQG